MLKDDGFELKRAAVLGAGVMGAQIAAHLANSGIPTLLYELPPKDGKPNDLATAAIKRLGKLKPPPLGSKAVLADVQPANYDQHLDQLESCDLIIEAIAERLDFKKSLFDNIENHVNANAILATNTSGLSISELASVLPQDLATRFVGVHFFNPPRYMHLVELIPHTNTRADVVDGLETVLTRDVGKGVVRAKDTPNFIGNRIGVFSMLSAMHHTLGFELGFDTVDVLTGPALGRPKSATYRTADVVGLDTMGHVIGTMRDQLADDPWHQHFDVPGWLNKLVEAGALGQKSGAGIFKKTKQGIEVLDLAQGDYRASSKDMSEAVSEILKIKNPAEKLAAMAQSDDKQAQFLWAVHRDLFHYCAYHLESIADSTRELDNAIKWGYGWKLGPFELWQASDWQAVARLIQDDLDAGKTMSDAPLPVWVSEIQHAHSSEGSYSASSKGYEPRSTLAVYNRQRQPQRLLGETSDTGKTVSETDAMRLWTLDDETLIASFKTKKNTISDGVVHGIAQAIDEAEKQFKGLVVWQTQDPFSFGADLTGAAAIVQRGDRDGLTAVIQALQEALGRLKFSSVPTVAGVRGMALGGGCELLLQCDRVVAAHESYIGLVEAGVGLLPGGGGLKEFAIRASSETPAGDTFPLRQKFFENIAMAKVSGSALEAREMGMLRSTDTIVMHADEVLHVALSQVEALHQAGYKPPSPNRTFAAAGRDGIATLKAGMVNMLSGGFISEHDFEIGSRIADVICGGAVDPGTPVNEAWLIKLEREHFADLAFMEKTQQRVMHTLTTGKPLRN
ncbi:MAG: 3-hydroxyacyl-CoA dehydrogenase/enoyl-CoA hydratase family protein [Pseudomonadota bacterium]